MKEPCGVGLVPWWLLPRPLSRLPAPLPELFPTSASGSPWGEGEVGNGAGRPPKVVFAGRRDNGSTHRAHTGRTPCTGGVLGLCANCASHRFLDRTWVPPTYGCVLKRVVRNCGRGARRDPVRHAKAIATREVPAMKENSGLSQASGRDDHQRVSAAHMSGIRPCDTTGSSALAFRMTLNNTPGRGCSSRIALFGSRRRAWRSCHLSEVRA